MIYRNMTTLRGLLGAGTALAAVVLGLPTAASAQPAANVQASNGSGVQTAPTISPTPEAEVSEVVVTAEKRSQRVIDVPASLSAVSGEQLLRSGVSGVEGLSSLVPSLSYSQGVAEEQSNVRIRGIGTQVFSPGVAPSVSYVIDGVVLEREAQAFGDLFDVDRVEVLKGPQSTLFGKNASAGVINITTKGPTKSLSVSADATIAEQGQRDYRVAVAGPITDTLGFRVSAYDTHYNGNIRNLYNGKDLNGSDTKGGRIKLLWTPTSRLRITGAADYRNASGMCCQFTLRDLTNVATANFIAPVVASHTNQNANVNADVFQRSESYGLSGQVDYDLDAVTLTSITAYRHYRTINNQDIDETPLTSPRVGAAAAYQLLDLNEGETKIGSWTQELRIANRGEHRFNYVAGFFFSDSEIKRDFFRSVPLCFNAASATLPIGSACPLPETLPSSFFATVQSRAMAGFADGTLKLIGPFSLIGGVRLNHEELSYTFVNNTATAVAAPPFLPRLATITGAKDFDDTVGLGRVGMKWALGPRTNLFALYSRGYKGAAFDLTSSFTAAIAAQQPIQPETSDAYEVNLKSELFARRLVLSASLFRTDYEGFQVQAFDTTAAAFRLLNAGSARTEGAELEATLRPVEGLTLTGGAAYTHARFTSFPGGPCFAGQPIAATLPAGSFGDPLVCVRSGTASLQNLKGGRVPNSPDWRFTLNGRYERGLGGSDYVGFIDAGLQSQTDVFFSLTQNPGTRQAGYLIANAAIGVRERTGRYEARLFVRNLTDEHYASSIFEAPLNNTPAGNFAQFLPRDYNRYVGGEVRVSF